MQQLQAKPSSNPMDCSRWFPSFSSLLYKIEKWGAPYFSVNSSGNISIRPKGLNSSSTHEEIDLLKVLKKVSDHKSSGGLGLQLPLIIRLPDVLKNRMESLQSAFESAICSWNYGSRYQGVYPVKSNQNRFIVEDIVRFGFPFRFGLEVGSKPELLLAMNCLCKGHPEALLICNGFKDKDYILLALIARKLAFNVVVVLEQVEELDLVIDLSTKLCVSPVIGLRAKLRTKHGGHFGSTSGERGKFGLTPRQILSVVKKLEKAGMLNCLILLHFHIGSQIPSITMLADGIGEATQIYCELVRLGACLQFIDVGGGLGIDYDGSKSSNSDVSVGYGLEEYASTVVQVIQQVCDSKSVKHPVICSESGRAIVSYHSIVIFEAISSSVSDSPGLNPEGLQHFVEGLTEDARADYSNLSAAVIKGEHTACLHYANKLKQYCLDQFKEGSLNIEQLAIVDELYGMVSKATGASEPIHTYLVNLSIFNSVPDFWAIGQMYPIVPIHRLDQKPTVKGILLDLTCDSDGKIDRFIGGESSLPLHDHRESSGGQYYLGMFLGGAYEEALGGSHNLLGSPSVVQVSSQSSEPEGFIVTMATPGQSCRDVLRTMQHEPEAIFKELKQRIKALGQVNGTADGMFQSVLAGIFSNMPYLTRGSSCS
ncbi:Arginine decarboxylase [Theobroma cacao]|uniref:Arginine decarboxylase n=1 Tax=Theobroma cacao TaxID=3641 RepID=A0A061EKU5_THECC|nr:Arginine decarboxylase [Theobroma cacao]